MDYVQRKVERVAAAMEQFMLEDPVWRGVLKGMPPSVEGPDRTSVVMAEALRRLAWVALQAAPDPK